MSSRNEPCLCGDPECPRCFPRYYSERDEGDMIDDAYERATQERVDDEREAQTKKEPKR
jgi:hypothetical protein